MTLSVDGSASINGSSGSSVVTGTLSCANAGNIICVAVTYNLTSGSVTSVTGGGVTFAKRATENTNANQPIDFWTGYSSGVFNSAVTVNFSGSSSFATAHAFAVSGAPSTNYFDTNASLPKKGSSGSSVTISTSAADTIILGMFRQLSDPNPNAGSGYTKIIGAGYQLTEYKVVSATQSGLSVSDGNANGIIADAIVMASPAASSVPAIMNQYNRRRAA